MSFALTDTLFVELAVMCEDVREEVGKKISLMGVFGGDIIAAELPATIRAAFYFTLRSTSPREHVIRLRAIADDAAEPFLKGNTPLNVMHEGAVGNVIIPLGYLKFEKPTTFHVEISVEDGNWIEVITKKISAGPIVR